MKKTFEISQQVINVAVRLLREHASNLKAMDLPACAAYADAVASQIVEEVVPQSLMTPEEQTAALTEIMGCGPLDEAVGNKG